METQPYNLAADWLSKFHTSPEPIQALWLVAMTVTVLGVTWLLMRALAALLARPGKNRLQGHLAFGVYEAPDGRWMVYLRDSGATPLAPQDRLAEATFALKDRLPRSP